MTGRQGMITGFVLYGIGAAALAIAAVLGIWDDVTGWFDDSRGVPAGDYYTTWPNDGGER